MDEVEEGSETVSNLKEKAIAAVNIIFRIEHSGMTPKHVLLGEKWVRLEDALVPEKKLEELKQKLQQIVDNYSLIDDHGVALVSKRKLEELLKELKTMNAKKRLNRK